MQIRFDDQTKEILKLAGYTDSEIRQQELKANVAQKQLNTNADRAAAEHTFGNKFADDDFIPARPRSS